ncbi:MAG: alginate lyase family protein [Odoribacter sp.]|nr:alginate lyase family protein [Odoribacter sp.]
MRSLILVILGIVFLAATCQNNERKKVKKQVTDLLQEQVIEKGNIALTKMPVTVTSFIAERSAGGINDFYSEGDYWWPDTLNPDGPYIRRDGETNPDNFVAHRHAMIRFSKIIGELTSAYVVSGDKKYTEHAMEHIRAWFIDSKTKMNLDLEYAQAIKGIVTGRGIGIIDAIHLIEVTQSLKLMENEKLISPEDLVETKNWFTQFLNWLTTHPYGEAEMNQANNHGTCWVMQVAAFASFTGNNELIDFCRERYKNVLLPQQMAEDGSFPLELKRTKPYGYSLFNLDAMATVCHLLTDKKHDIWNYTDGKGNNINKGIKYLYPYVIDKTSWSFEEDVMYWEEWPVAQPFLLFSAWLTDNVEHLKTWMSLNHYPDNPEVI